MLQLTIAGNVGKEPELRQAGSSDVLSFSVAVTTHEKGAKGTQWVEVSIFGKRGATLAEFIHKGTKIVATGSMKLRSYEVKVEGRPETRYSLDLVADNVTLMDPAPGQGGQQRGGHGGDEPYPDPPRGGGFGGARGAGRDRY